MRVYVKRSGPPFGALEQAKIVIDETVELALLHRAMSNVIEYIQEEIEQRESDTDLDEETKDLLIASLQDRLEKYQQLNEALDKKNEIEWDGV